LFFRPKLDVFKILLKKEKSASGIALNTERKTHLPLNPAILVSRTIIPKISHILLRSIDLDRYISCTTLLSRLEKKMKKKRISKASPETPQQAHTNHLGIRPALRQLAQRHRRGIMVRRIPDHLACILSREERVGIYWSWYGNMG
jgi:hypothetical protein